MAKAEPTNAQPMTWTSGTLLVEVGRIARRTKQVMEAGETTFSETSVLSWLERNGPMTASALANAEHVRPQAIGVIVDTLQARDLVARQPDPSDRRKVLVSLTDAGREALTDKRNTVAARMSRLLETDFTGAERQQLEDVLPLLSRVANRL